MKHALILIALVLLASCASTTQERTMPDQPATVDTQPQHTTQDVAEPVVETEPAEEITPADVLPEENETADIAENDENTIDESLQEELEQIGKELESFNVEDLNGFGQ